MAVSQRIPIRIDDVFPQRAYVLVVEAAIDFEKVQSGPADMLAGTSFRPVVNDGAAVNDYLVECERILFAPEYVADPTELRAA